MDIILSNGSKVNVPEGADPTAFRRYAEARLRRQANPKPKKSKPRRRRTARRTFRASQVLARMTLSGAERQAENRGRATTELVSRINGQEVA